MKIALIGASGNIGSRITSEAISRQHNVTAMARHPEKIASAFGITAVKADVADTQALPELLRGHDAVVTSVRFSSFAPVALLDAVRKSGVRRYLVVGGAGSLKTASGGRVIDDPHFPAAYKNEAQKGAEFLAILQKETVLDWTFFSPAALIAPGERTGKFRLGLDDLIVDSKGESRISIEDYALALVDELEQSRHIKRRFTIGY